LTKELGPGFRRDDDVSAKAGKDIVVSAEAKKTVIPAKAGIQEYVLK
jgi:hypothetical protein